MSFENPVGVVVPRPMAGVLQSRSLQVSAQGGQDQWPSPPDPLSPRRGGGSMSFENPVGVVVPRPMAGVLQRVSLQDSAQGGQDLLQQGAEDLLIGEIHDVEHEVTHAGLHEGLHHLDAL